jgi:hypothetical protein
VWWFRYIISALRSLRQEDRKFKTVLSYIALKKTRAGDVTQW